MREGLAKRPPDPYTRLTHKSFQPDEDDIGEDLIVECMEDVDCSRRVAIAHIKAGTYPNY